MAGRAHEIVGSNDARLVAVEIAVVVEVRVRVRPLAVVVVSVAERVVVLVQRRVRPFGIPRIVVLVVHIRLGHVVVLRELHFERVFPRVRRWRVSLPLAHATQLAVAAASRAAVAVVHSERGACAVTGAIAIKIYPFAFRNHAKTTLQTPKIQVWAPLSAIY